MFSVHLRHKTFIVFDIILEIRIIKEMYLLKINVIQYKCFKGIIKYYSLKIQKFNIIY